MARTWNDIYEAVETAQLAKEAAETLSHLRSARDILDEMINERMATAVVTDGVSIRAAASMAGFSENTAGPRLARSSVLGSYAREDGRITSAEVHRARYDYQTSQSKSPMKFTARKSPRKESDD